MPNLDNYLVLATVSIPERVRGRFRSRKARSLDIFGFQGANARISSIISLKRTID
jgi:hypothetical protein